MPVIEGILPELSKAKIFTKVDCKVTEESSRPLADTNGFVCPSGFHVLLKYFSSVCMTEAVEGLDGVYAIADDILVAGTGDTMKNMVTDHDLKIKELLGRCQERYI